MARVAIGVPRWPDGGHRDQAWMFVRDWMSRHYPQWPRFEGHDPGPGEARAQAAEAAGQWDAIVFNDADTLAHPDAIEAAVTQCIAEDRMVICADSHMYLSKASSDRILSGGAWFCRPRDFGDNGIYARPCSGVFAVPRSLYDRIGGYPALGPWGQEDQVWFELCRIFDGPVTWTAEHITLHLWHPPADRDPNRREARRNYRLWQQLARLRGPSAQRQARELMAEVGHRIP
ncbi:glycosyltransferase family A protein [Mycolicibacterium sphagni]|uniref:Glycosyltransferase n=1 Tax=Mycolicibacterium sphagni TaxID=1786 RepID=A0A255DM62_9MYCO|nr:glycosyltransferase family A protein [Mycolicibacterium sphagni]OYN80436.1 hypothetical protein CG716_09945 [Mycolicibacterium sphagni]